MGWLGEARGLPQGSVPSADVEGSLATLPYKFPYKVFWLFEGVCEGKVEGVFVGWSEFCCNIGFYFV